MEKLFISVFVLLLSACGGGEKNLGNTSALGNLTVSGADTPIIGTNFVPTYTSGQLDWGRGIR